jgi:hypothetical protein
MFDYPRLIQNAERAYNSANSDWAKEYWLEVITKLKQNIDSH